LWSRLRPQWSARGTRANRAL